MKFRLLLGVLLIAGLQPAWSQELPQPKGAGNVADTQNALKAIKHADLQDLWSDYLFRSPDSRLLVYGLTSAENISRLRQTDSNSNADDDKSGNFAKFKTLRYQYARLAKAYEAYVSARQSVQFIATSKRNSTDSPAHTTDSHHKLQAEELYAASDAARQALVKIAGPDIVEMLDRRHGWSRAFQIAPPFQISYRTDL